MKKEREEKKSLFVWTLTKEHITGFDTHTHACRQTGTHTHTHPPLTYIHSHTYTPPSLPPTEASPPPTPTPTTQITSHTYTPHRPHAHTNTPVYLSAPIHIYPRNTHTCQYLPQQWSCRSTSFQTWWAFFSAWLWPPCPSSQSPPGRSVGSPSTAPQRSACSSWSRATPWAEHAQTTHCKWLVNHTWGWTRTHTHNTLQVTGKSHLGLNTHEQNTAGDW